MGAPTLAVLLALGLSLAGCGVAPRAHAPAPPQPAIDLSHWKLQLPLADPRKVEPPELQEKAASGELEPYFYFDRDGALVFFTQPLETTPNSRYSRTELSEQMQPRRDDVNWPLSRGGRMRGRLRVAGISRDAEGNPHRTIVMQIHARLTEEQRARIGAGSTTAPPLLKVYWTDGRVRLLVKKLSDPHASDTEILHRDAWVDDEPFVFPQRVGHDPFTLEVRAASGRVEVALNGSARHVFETPSLERWPFENYFKAGNYLQTTDEGAYATIVYYELEVTHP
jgi:hypothetical protein